MQKACIGIEAEIFVVDNNSTDGSREYLEPKFPNVIFKWNNVNAGFAKASNSVLKEAKGTHILFLNPDTIIPEDCLINCLNFFNEHTLCGALGVKMVDGSGCFLRESKRSFPSPQASFYKLSGLSKIFPTSKVFSAYYAGHLPENNSHEVEVLAGAFMMLSKRVLDKVKGFDEIFFMYGEDIDLSYRIQKAGFKNYFFAGTTIIHFKGESTQKLSKRYPKHFYGAMKLFVRKHYSGKKIVLPGMLAAIFLGKALASLKISTGKMFSVKKSVALNGIAIAGTKKEFELVLSLLKEKVRMNVLGRLNVNEGDKVESIGNIHAQNEILIPKETAQVIFCEGALTFKNIIALVELLPNKINFLFHSADSRSIVGGGIKNSKSVFIELK